MATTRSADVTTGAVAVTVFGVGSVAEVAVAVLVAVPVAVAVRSPVIVTVIEAPAASVPAAQDTFVLPLAIAHVPTVGEAAVHRICGEVGARSPIVTVRASDGPALVTVIDQVTGLPATTGLVTTDFVMVSEASVATVNGTLAELLDALASGVELLNAAVLVSGPALTDAATRATTVKFCVAAGLRGVTVRQVTC